MSTRLLQSFSADVQPVTAAKDPDEKRLWFVLALPAVLACLVALVPVAGTAAIVPFLLVLVPLVLWTAFRDTERAIYIYFAWCWLDGTIRGMLHSDPVSIVARDIVLGVVVVGWGTQRLQTRYQDAIRVPPGTLLVALFILICLLQMLNPNAAGLLQSIGGLKLHLSAIPLLFLGYDVIRRPAQVRSLFLFLTLMTLIMGVTSYAQYAHGPSWTWAHFPGSHEVIGSNLAPGRLEAFQKMTVTFKPPGTTTAGGSSGFYAGILFPLAFVLPLLSGRLHFSRKVNAILAAILLAFIVIIFINAVRAALVIAFCGLLLLGLLIGGKQRARILAAIAFCLVLGSIGFIVSQSVSQGGVTDRFATTFADPVNALHKDRRTFFDDAASIVAHAPFGVGLGRVGGSAGRLGGGDSHTSLGFSVFSEAYLGSIMYETGIPGGLLISAIALMFTARSFASLGRLTDPDSKFLAAAIAAVFVVIFANFFVTPILLGPPGSVLFWLLGGVSLRVFAPKAKTL